MHEKNGGGSSCNPVLEESPQQPKQQNRVCDMYRDVDGVISRRIQTACKMIQIKREERELPQMKRIEKMRPSSGICDIAVSGNECIIEMK